MAMNETVRILAQYALAKKGAQLDHGMTLTDDMTHPSIQIPRASWGHFFEVSTDVDFTDDDDDELDEEDIENEVAPRFVNLPVLKSRLEELRKDYPAIHESGWMERDGHVQMTVPLNLPIEFLKSLIDEGYNLIWKKLNDDQKFLIERAAGPIDNLKLLDEMIDRYKLKLHREAIHGIARHAILLREKVSVEAEIAVGSTKIGGSPDLPPKTPWPAYSDGRPLAFLCQINLKEIAVHGTVLEGLPNDGVITVFSAWGWVSEDDWEPQIPDDDLDTQEGWTAILHASPGDGLVRRKTPANVNQFQASAMELTPVLSLPNHREEPALSALGWDEETLDRFDAMQGDYRAIVMRYWLGKLDSLASHHLFGGYALFQQQYPEVLFEKDAVMLLQIGSDGDMCWGDGGELTFYTDAVALREGRFEKVWGESQGG